MLPSGERVPLDRSLSLGRAPASDVRLDDPTVSRAHAQVVTDGRRVTLQTPAGPLTARRAIITAGPWSGGLAATLGVAIPGRATLEQVAYLTPRSPDTPADGNGAAPATAAGLPPIFICHGEQAPYGLPVPGSPLYKIGIQQSGPATEPDAQQAGPDATQLARLQEVARRYLPGYDPAPARTERCIYDNSPDEDFVLDRRGNVVIGCGTSGHGFKFGPLCGEWLAALAMDGERADKRFALARFAPPA